MENAKTYIRGLQNFTEAVHRSVTIEKEREVVNCELAKIRKEFKEGKMNAYDRRKSVLKMAYIEVLGYEVDTGFVEVIQLIGSPKFFDKHIGYMAFTLLFSNVPESTRMIINTLQQDLENNLESYVNDALSVIAQLANVEMADTLGPSVVKICTGFCETSVKKRALIAMRQLYKQQPQILSINPDFMKVMEKLFSGEMDNSIINSLVLFLEAIVEKEPELLKPFIPELISSLQRLVNHEAIADLDYHGTLSPWLQIKLFRLLAGVQLDEQQKKMFWECASVVLQQTDTVKYDKPCSEKTIQMAVVFEVMGIMIVHEKEEYFKTLLPLLGSLVEDKEVNVRYLALDTFVLLGQANYKKVCQNYLVHILNSLEETDVTIRRRAIEVLYSLCTPESVRKVVNQLLHVLENDEGELKEELVVKISILSEMDVDKDQWYVDTMLLATCLGGEFVRPELWDRVLNSIGHAAQYAVQKIVQVLAGGCWHEEFLKMSCVIIGEYAQCLGNLAQHTATYIAKQLPYVHSATKRLILTCLIKMAKELPDIRPTVSKALKICENAVDAEVQQRASEFKYIMDKNYYEIAIAPLPERVINEQNEGKANEREKKDDEKFMSQEKLVSPTPQEPQKTSGDILNSVINSTPSTTQKAPENANAMLVDILGGIPQSTITQQIPTKAALQLDKTEWTERGYKGSAFSHSAADAELGKKVRFIHKKLLTQKEGVIFQDANIQIGMRLKTGNVVDVALYIGNTKDETITGQIALKGEDGINCMIQNNQLNIEGKKQQQVLCRFEAKDVFLQAPMVGMNYTIGGNNIQLAFSLPITLIRYVQPNPNVAFLNESGKTELAECFVQTQMQTSLSTNDIGQLLTGYGFAVKPAQNQILAGGNVLGKDVGIFIDIIGGSYKVGVGSTSLQIAEVIHDVMSYLLSANF
ncbi:AP-2 complex subunit alpha-2, putative [Entamoeba invadens IP1]|uniref:AP-2 complex subunit alpha n=1 Tax=Entamoeba invadens IP1 TaxID=370355 RepID=A0A0A1TWA6_ENTIV|nr:AP-2 complex subunit alpha-2, putative [Entamoeba invadens IP1]ELP84954.1 AP-2 complex subunit alpha-2, putative [Entamoeba invadens IP1]|eukprot:XP_004184300.1 AP-2 complex subunit alpha-2, putative [Entamoeba invadens IP1]